jgi:hypothetical protein
MNSFFLIGGDDPLPGKWSPMGSGESVVKPAKRVVNQ